MPRLPHALKVRGLRSEFCGQCDRDRSDKVAKNPHPKVSGFLLRSDVVAGWPGLLVDGYAKEDGTEPLDMLRMDRLSANVLICLFAGEIKEVDIHQKPETLHFGLDSDDQGKTYYKKLKNDQGQAVEFKIDNIPWKEEHKRTINIDQLKQYIEDKLKSHNITFTSFTSAQFALEMIEGVEKVRFLMRDN